VKTRIGGAGGDAEQPTLCDLLDRLIETGVVARGSIVVSVAGIELIYIELSLLVASVETAFGASKPGPVLEAAA
jgi:hypothetical protein